MSPLAKHAATTPIPVQLSEPECNAARVRTLFTLVRNKADLAQAT
jgi:hypothetical protein